MPHWRQMAVLMASGIVTSSTVVSRAAGRAPSPSRGRATCCRARASVVSRRMCSASHCCHCIFTTSTRASRTRQYRRTYACTHRSHWSRRRHLHVHLRGSTDTHRNPPSRAAVTQCMLTHCVPSPAHKSALVGPVEVATCRRNRWTGNPRRQCVLGLPGGWESAAHLEGLDAAHEAVEGEGGLGRTVRVREELEDAQRGLPPPPHKQHAQEQPHAALDEPAPADAVHIPVALSGQNCSACWVARRRHLRSGGVDWRRHAGTSRELGVYRPQGHVAAASSGRMRRLSKGTSIWGC